MDLMEVDEVAPQAGAFVWNDGDAISDALLAQACEDQQAAKVQATTQQAGEKQRIPLTDRTSEFQPAYLSLGLIQSGKQGSSQLGRANSLLGPGQPSPKPPLGRPPLSPSCKPAAAALLGLGDTSKVQQLQQQGLYAQDQANRSPAAAAPQWYQQSPVGLSQDSPTRARSQPQSPGTTLAAVLQSAQGAQTQAALRSPGTAKRGLSFR